MLTSPVLASLGLAGLSTLSAFFLAADQVNIPQLTATGTLVAIAAWVIKAAIARSDAEQKANREQTEKNLQRAEAEAKAYRELLVTMLGEVRSDVRQFVDALGSLVEAQRSTSEEQRRLVIELHNLFNVASRTERMLLQHGIPGFAAGHEPVEEQPKRSTNPPPHAANDG